MLNQVFIGSGTSLKYPERCRLVIKCMVPLVDVAWSRMHDLWRENAGICRYVCECSRNGGGWEGATPYRVVSTGRRNESVQSTATAFLTSEMSLFCEWASIGW